MFIASKPLYILMKLPVKMENNKIENEEAENMEGKIISLSQSTKQIETKTYLKQKQHKL